MSFQLVNRRIHLYLGLVLLPWVLMYAISSLVINHGPFFNRLASDGTPLWSQRFEMEYRRPVQVDADVREMAAQILREFELGDSFFASRPAPERLNIHSRSFWSATRLTYFIDEGRLVAEDRRFQWNNFLLGLHFRGGYFQEPFLDDLWAFVLDIVCIGFLAWIGSGIYMWWKLKQTRFWGGVTLSGGLISFILLLLAL